MNLLTDPWIPVKTKTGKVECICACELGRADLIATNAPRADFNAALMTFLIGLLQTFYAPRTSKDWKTSFEQPPNREALKKIFEKEENNKAFNLDGEGKRFMQDALAKNSDKGLRPIEEMVFGAPGDSTKENNIDHFLKRTNIHRLCASCAASALITANNFAEDGGQGYFQSMRGNGYVSTLICIDEKQHEPSLWKNFWLNVLVASQDAPKTYAWHEELPWEKNEKQEIEIDQKIAEEKKAKTEGYKDRIKELESEKKKIQENRDDIGITKTDGNPYFAWMRRFWLEFTDDFGACSLCHQEDKLVSQFYKVNKGFKYPKEVWQNKHPLSPVEKYTRKNTENNKKYKDKLLAVEMTRNGLPYTYWQAFLEQSDTRAPARVVSDIFSVREKRRINHQLIIHAFGFAMKSNSPLGWFESKTPLYLVDDELCSTVESEISRWINAADRIGNSQTGYITCSIRCAWFDEDPNKNKDKKDSYRNEKAIEISKLFWNNTEAKFFELVKQLYDNAESLDDVKKREFRQEWYDHICKEVRILFNYWAFKGSIQTNPKRIAKAYNNLNRNLYFTS
jgi:CRISPR system Cascade subunit CasA